MDITTILGQYAFPIVACIGMAYYVKYVTDNNREDMANLRKEHEIEVDKLAEAVNNNTLALQKLIILLGKDSDN